MPSGAPDPSALLVAVAGVVLFSLLVAVTRVRVLAVVWRLCAIACAAAPAVIAWSWWSVDDPMRSQLPPLPSLPDLGPVRAPDGLEVMALVFAAALVGYLLLVVRTSRSAG
jgi:hypothetical protein